MVKVTKNKREEHKKWCRNFLFAYNGDNIIIDSLDVELLCQQFSTILSSLEKITSNCYPDFGIAYYFLGTVYYALERYQDAVACFKKIISIVPDYGQAHYALLFTYLQNNNISKAKKLRAKISKLCPFALTEVDGALIEPAIEGGDSCLRELNLLLFSYNSARNKDFEKTALKIYRSKLLDPLLVAMCSWDYGIAYWQRNKIVEAKKELYQSVTNFADCGYSHFSVACSHIYEVVRIEAELKYFVEHSNNITELRKNVGMVYQDAKKFQEKLKMEMIDSFIPIVVAKLAIFYIVKEIVNFNPVDFDMFRFIEETFSIAGFTYKSRFRYLQGCVNALLKYKEFPEPSESLRESTSNHLCSALKAFYSDEVYGDDVFDEDLEEDIVQENMLKIRKEIGEIKGYLKAAVKDVEKKRGTSRCEVWTHEGPKKYADFKKMEKKCFVVINERIGEIKVGKSKVELKKLQRKLLIALLESFGNVATYKWLFERLKRENWQKEKSYCKPDNQVVHRWMSDLYKQTNQKLKQYIVSESGEGYRLKNSLMFAVVYSQEK
jgi:tetratricopeptide (TPR) repeat protein